MVLPEPLSPTSPSVSPLPIVNDDVVDGVDVAHLPPQKPDAADREPDRQVVDLDERRAVGRRRVGASMLAITTGPDRPSDGDPSATAPTAMFSNGASNGRQQATRRDGEWMRRPGVASRHCSTASAQRAANAQPVGGFDAGRAATPSIETRRGDHDVEARRAAQQPGRVRVAGSA